MTPSDVDRCSFRDINAMIVGAGQREKERSMAEWERSLIVAQAIMNGYSKKPKPLDYLSKRVRNHKTSGVSLAEYRAWRKDALKQIAAKHGNADNP